MTTNPPRVRRVVVVVACIVASLVAAIIGGLVIGPTSIGTGRVVGDLRSRLSLGHSTLTPLQATIVWQLRAPRMVLGLLAGALLSVAGGTYQGVFAIPSLIPTCSGSRPGLVSAPPSPLSRSAQDWRL